MTMTPDRARGCLLGLAVGDAVGTTLEFRPRGTFEPITDMVGGGPFRLLPGQWTDDTSMALCLADSLIEDEEFSLQGQADRYVRWWRTGYNSATTTCFDIGNATAAALRRYLNTGDPQAGDPSPNQAGNGCLMRLAPVPIRFSNEPLQAVKMSELQATTTHGADECLIACRLFGELLVRALNGATKEEILNVPPEHTTSMPATLSAIVVGRSYAKKPRNAIRGSGYVVESLEAALWAFFTTQNFRDCILAAANLGDDADTTAAIAGQLAGAHYGLVGIPPEWVEKTWNSRHILNTADCLRALRDGDQVLM